MEKLTEDSDGLERYQQIDSKIGVMLHIDMKKLNFGRLKMQSTLQSRIPPCCHDK